METTLFGHIVKLKSHYCELKGYKKCPVERPYVNLYVQFNGCNATCKFCEFQEVAQEFDFKKFNDILQELKESVEVRKISFTGGEPTLQKGNFAAALIDAQSVITESFYVVNTNGLNLSFLYQSRLNKRLNSIAVSRHHYNDKENNEILGFNAPSLSTLKKLQENESDKFRLHLSCNLIKGCIDSPEEIYKYLEVASQVGIRDAGFVSLMKINDYAKEHFIDFQSLKFEKESFHKIKEWSFENKCKCNNYLYIPTDTSGDVVQVYSRCVMKPFDTVSTLVFDGKNLRTGFNGTILK